MTIRRNLFILVLLLGSPLAALAANEVTHPQSITLVLPTDSSSYTLSGYSQYDSLAISNTYFAFTLSQGGRVTLTSSDRKSFSTNSASPLKVSTTCTSNESTITVDIEAPYTTTSINITPSGTCSSGQGSGSGGGGGGGGGGGNSSTPYVSATPTVQTVDKVALLKQQIAETQKKIADKLAQTQVIYGGGLTKELEFGARGEEVSKLQTMLAKDKDVYPEGTVSGYYGGLTRQAVRNFQTKYGLPAVGRVGVKTIAKLNDIFGNQTVSAKTPSAQTPASSAPVAGGITQELSFGENGDEVSKLQTMLAKDPEIYPEGTVSGYYGGLTRQAVRNFQTKYGLPAVGRVGPLTIQKLNEVFGGQTPAPATGAQIQTPAATGVSAQAAAIQKQIQEAQAKLLLEQAKSLQEKINSLKK